jgi:hypothetical protein
MKKRWVFVSITLVITTLGIILGCSNTLDTPDNHPWASFASNVALEINMSEDKVFDAFEQAFKEGTDIPSDRLSPRIPAFTDDDVQQIAKWYQNRPEGVSLRCFNTIEYFGAEIQFLSSGSDDILDGLASRVASILEIDKQYVIDAFHQVTRELVDEMHRDGLSRLVEEGCLTVEQVDTYFQWYLSRPDTISPGRMSPLQ